MSTAIIAEVDKTIQELVQAFGSGEAIYDLDLEKLNLKIKITGQDWAGIVDRSVAKFLLDLNDKLTEQFKLAGIAIPESEHGVVALKIEDGCLEAILKYSKQTLDAFRKLKPAQQIMLVTAVLIAVGIFKADQIIGALNQVPIEEARSNERVELVQTVAQIVESTRELQSPVRSLVGRMAPNDTIQLPGFEGSVDKAGAKKNLVAGTRSTPKQFYIDYCYKVSELSTKNPERWMITLEYGDVSFRAHLMISEEEVSQLMQDFQEAHSRNSEIAPDLQVTAKISAKGIISASVIGIGKPRNNAVRLSEALVEAREQTSQGDSESPE